MYIQKVDNLKHRKLMKRRSRVSSIINKIKFTKSLRLLTDKNVTHYMKKYSVGQKYFKEQDQLSRISTIFDSINLKSPNLLFKDSTFTAVNSAVAKVIEAERVKKKYDEVRKK